MRKWTTEVNESGMYVVRDEEGNFVVSAFNQFYAHVKAYQVAELFEVRVSIEEVKE